MLSRLYIEALLVDEEAADAIWETWTRGKLTTYEAGWGWWRIAQSSKWYLSIQFETVW